MSSKLQIIGEQAQPPSEGGEAGTSSSPFMGKVAMVNLGCAKNQVDAEVMLGALHSAGFVIVDDPNEADVAVVNTCGFLQPAVEEGIDAILDLSELKQGRLRKLIVAGCMVERYGEDLKESLPEVDHFLGGNDLLKVIYAAKEGYDSPLVDGARPYFLYDDQLPRVREDGSVSAFVKISEGCNRPCSFCIIPRIRGSLRSRTADSVIHEINNLGASGVREVNLVAQDLTAYGSDRKRDGGEDFPALLRRLDSETNVDWIRLYYAYPLGVTEELLREIVQAQRVVNYLDIPLQHVSENVLKLMKRPLGKCASRPLVEMMRRVAPEISLRTTFIVGHPGESEDDIEELAQFLREAQFDHVGIFTYSKEDGTPSFDLPEHIAEEEKQQRRNYLMEIQQEVQHAKLEKCLGSSLPVLLEGAHPETELLLRGRTEFQGPEVDGEVIINDLHEEIAVADCKPGRMGLVEMTEVSGYDLVGTLVALTP